MKSSMINVCPSDGLPCSYRIKNVGIGACVKRWRDKVRICPRFSDVSFLEDSIVLKIRGEVSV